MLSNEKKEAMVMNIKMLRDSQGEVIPYCLTDAIYNKNGSPAGAADFGAAPTRHTHTIGEMSSGVLPMANGGTGSTDAAAARAALGVTPANIGAAAASHGTHVEYSTTAPIMDGAAAVGAAATLARSDHRHPVDTSRAAASHTHAASQVTAGTLGGQVLANAAAQGAAGTAQLRNIYAGTGAMTAGTTALTNGVIYCQYE